MPSTPNSARKLFELPCGHGFHKSCLEQSREHDIKGCPLCRQAIPPGLTPVGARERILERRRREGQATNHPSYMQLYQNATYSRHVLSRVSSAREAVRARMLQQQALRQQQEQAETPARAPPPRAAPSTLQEESRPPTPPNEEHPPLQARGPQGGAQEAMEVCVGQEGAGGEALAESALGVGAHGRTHDR